MCIAEYWPNFRYKQSDTSDGFWCHGMTRPVYADIYKGMPHWVHYSYIGTMYTQTLAIQHGAWLGPSWSELADKRMIIRVNILPQKVVSILSHPNKSLTGTRGVALYMRVIDDTPMHVYCVQENACQGSEDACCQRNTIFRYSLNSRLCWHFVTTTRYWNVLFCVLAQ